MVFPEVVAVSHEAAEAPAEIGGLDVEPVLSLPTTVMVWLIALPPLETENVVKAGLPNNTGTFPAVTRTVTPTLKLPPVVVMSMVAV
jgi:hypothetical protein